MEQNDAVSKPVCGLVHLQYRAQAVAGFYMRTRSCAFPPELVPGVGHPLVDKLGDHALRRLMMRKLESYNAFTEKLEYKAVMAASIKIAQNPQAFGLSEQAGREARLIVTDESHHAYVAIELIKQIPGFSELPPLTP